MSDTGGLKKSFAERRTTPPYPGNPESRGPRSGCGSGKTVPHVPGDHPKDLDVLQAHGRIQRSHGGALPARESALEDPTLREKEKLHRKEKLQIAAAAARMVREGQVVILDSGTTTTAIARALRKFQNLTIITNAVNIAAELSGSSLEVILTGGTLRKELILAGGADCGRDAEAAERGHSFSRRGWFRRATWIDYTEPA